MTDSYSFKYIEEKWQKKWQESGSFKTNLTSPKEKNYYVLEMLPYPSGKVHMGHVRNYTIGDLIARYKRSKGFNVLYPMGFDAFGLPAENAAKENNSHPKKWTYSNINDMKDQLNRLGFSWDKSRELITCDPEYTKIEQQIFIEFYKNNLAYRKESWVNWDPIENTVLANEQVVDGKGWRSGADVVQKKLNQWFLKITDFANELLEDINLLNGWPENVKNMQIGWIGKSQGAIVNFKIKNSNNNIEVYTTRPETLFGGTFVALSTKHSLSLELAEKNSEILAFIKKYENIKNIEEDLKNLPKEGVFTGLYCINPVNNTEIPVYIANYVLDYATSSVFGCPAHDSRDFEFATNYKLPIIHVISSKDNDLSKVFESDNENDILINSTFLNNLTVKDAKVAIINYLEEHNLGLKKTSFKLKDWSVSRQRYWGTPVPIIYCNDCGVVPEKLENLPILLPEDVDFTKDGNPLNNHPTFKHTKCPICSKNAVRDTDTFDTFMESSWYFINYITVNTNKSPFDNNLLNNFLPVDQYIGGIEHAIMHLLYARFFFKALNKIGYINNIKEPFLNLLTQGMITHKTYKTKNTNKWVFPDSVIEKDNYFITTDTNEEVIVGKVEKMSKSKKNIVDPVYICNTYGADSARMFILSDSPPDKGLEWSDEGIEGIYKFLNRLWRFVINFYNTNTANLNTDEINPTVLKNQDLEFYIKLQQYIKNIEDYTQNNHFNKTISLSRELFNLIAESKDISNNVMFLAIKCLLIMLNPIVPHITEELWEKLGHTTLLAKTPYPMYNANYLKLTTCIVAVQINGKTKATISVDVDINQSDLLIKVQEINHINIALTNKEIKKVIYVPKKIINIII